MSKKNPKVTPEETAMPTPETENKKRKGNIAPRLLGILFVAVYAVAVVLLITGANSEISGVVGLYNDIATYLYIIGSVAAVILAIIAIFNAEKASKLLPLSLLLFSCGAFAYTVAYTIVAKISTGEFGFDIISFAFCVLGIVSSIFVALKRIGKVAVFYLLQLILTAGYTALIAISVMENGASLTAEFASVELMGLLLLVAAVWLLINSAWAIVRFIGKGKTALDIVRCILSVVFGVVAAFAAFSLGGTWIFAFMAIAIAGLQLALAFVFHQKLRSEKEETEEEEEYEQPILSEAQVAEGYYTETYAEAYAYEGGPVNGVVMAEEAIPSFLPNGPHVNTAGYDFYNCKSFDPFIASLDNDERNEFTDLFILRFRGDMPEIPSYEVGGNNAEFFHLIFIYLGKYRDRMSSKLLNKIYQFSNKLN